MHPDKRPKPHQPPHQTTPDQSCYNALDRDKLVIAKAIGALSLINTASHTLLSVLTLYLSLDEQATEKERAEIMSTVVEAFAAIDNAVDQVTTDAADEIQRAASQIQILINTNKASDVDASPIINKLLSLSNTLRNTSFQTLVDQDPNLATATNVTANIPNPTNPNPNANSGDNSIPENSSAETNPTTNTQSSTVIGVSDSDNPLASSSPSPLGSQRPIDSTLKPPTDDLMPTNNNQADMLPTAPIQDNNSDSPSTMNDGEEKTPGNLDNNSDSTTASGNIENG